MARSLWSALAPLATILALLGAGVYAGPSAAADGTMIHFFRIGTGATSGTYFPIGGSIANAVSNPPGSRACGRGGSCGVPGLIAVAQATHGSVDNVDQIAAGSLESGLCQSDVAYWAYNGKGIYKKKGPVRSLRAVANLYPENVHLVVARDSAIETVSDLEGKRVSLGELRSGTLVDAQIILRAYGLTKRDVQAVYLRPGLASDMLRDGRLDAFFLVAGHPVTAVSALAEQADVRLVPLAGKPVETLRRSYPFLTESVIPAGVYRGVEATPTLSVGAQFVVSAEVDSDLVYGITQALWHPNTLGLLARNHPEGKRIKPELALEGIAIPLHPGAERYYRDVGLLE